LTVVNSVDKVQDFKLRIYNAVENVKRGKSSEIVGTLMTLNNIFCPKMLINSLLKTLLRAVLNEPEIFQVLLAMFLKKIRNWKKRMLS
jgi:hypothetical protein